MHISTLVRTCYKEGRRRCTTKAWRLSMKGNGNRERQVTRLKDVAMLDMEEAEVEEENIMENASFLFLCVVKLKRRRYYANY